MYNTHCVLNRCVFNLYFKYFLLSYFTNEKKNRDIDMKSTRIIKYKYSQLQLKKFPCLFFNGNNMLTSSPVGTISFSKPVFEI